MRISKQAVADNKARVVEAAGRMLREKGFEGLAVAEVMKEAGLTHGGFYNHFDSKEELAATAMAQAFEGAVTRIEKRVRDARSSKQKRETFEDYVACYLAKETRDAPGENCPMAALGTDAARHGRALRAEFAAGLARYLQAFAAIVPAETDGGERAAAITTLSTLIGALTLARACAGTNEALSEGILTTVRDQLLRSEGSRAGGLRKKRPAPKRS